jgi:methylenetetrahydrofolate dehydrogenase (NADP+)/methenyltetrahydrofolate cyclohydrolase
MIVTTHQIVDKIKTAHAEYFLDFKNKFGRKAVLGIVRVGDNKVSTSYIRIKNKYAESVGVEALEYTISEEQSQEYLENEIEQACGQCDGVIVQLPLPKKFDTKKVLEKIDAKKDIDQLRMDFVGEKPGFVQPVVFSIKEIIKEFNIDLKNKKVVVLGQGLLVGQPFSVYLDGVDIKHIKLDKNSSQELVSESLKGADVLVTGVGKQNMVTKEMVSSGVTIIDAGTSEDGDTIVGDVSPECGEVASLMITTPGGVGPLTVCGLFNNLKIATEYANK